MLIFKFQDSFFENMNVLRHEAFLWLVLLLSSYILFHLEVIPKRTWKNVRDNRSKCLNNHELQAPPGAVATNLKKCKLFNQTLFLSDTLANRKSQ